MGLAELLARRPRAIDVGVTNIEFSRFLHEQLGEKYLGLTHGNPAPAPPDRLAEQVAPYLGSEQIGNNNAELLVFAGRLERHLWFFGRYSHAAHVVWVPGLRWSSLVAALGLVKNALLGRLSLSSAERPPRAGAYALSFKVLKRKPQGARRYLSPLTGLPSFFRTLGERRVCYAVLRWFETLPSLPGGEDLDLLVSDEAATTCDRLLGARPGLIPCDLYSVTGVSNTDYHNMAYYPPPVAEKILGNATHFRSLYRVPAPRERFLSLAYHALYHKGYASGLAEHRAAPPQVAAPDHDYPDHDYSAVLAELAASLGASVPITLNDLDDYLEAAGWRPGADTLARLALDNAWLAQRLRGDLHEENGRFADITAFFVRERAYASGCLDEILLLLEQEGFLFLDVRRLAQDAVKRVSGGVRGGNWDQGPYPVSGGEPAVMIVALDLIPITPSPLVKARFPLLENERTLVKETIRSRINLRLAPGARYNAVHSSDNLFETAYYLRLALGEEGAGVLRDILAQAATFRRRFKTPEEVVKTLTKNGRRAKLELIRYGDRLAVKKTYLPGRERFLAREVIALRELSAACPQLPRLLDAGDNFIIYPYYEDDLRLDRGGLRLLIPLEVMKTALSAIKFLYERGYAHGDFIPGNLLRDRREGVKVIDFEFLHRYEEKPATFAQSFDLVGFGPEHKGDLPAQLVPNYATVWQPLVGLSLDKLLYAPPWEQHLLRLHYMLTTSTKLTLQRRYRLLVRSLARAARWAWRHTESSVLGKALRWLAS